MVSARRDERQRLRNGLSGHNGLNLSAVGVDFYGRLAVAANLLSKVVRCGAK